MRLVQRTLVYVIGLSPRLAKEELLRRHEFLSLSEDVVPGTQSLCALPLLATGARTQTWHGRSALHRG